MSDYIIFEPLQTNNLDAQSDIADLEDAYHEVKKRYREGMKTLRQLKTHEVPKNKIIIIDRERQKLHNQAKRLGQLLGISEKEVFAELTTSNENLSEYDLPEFKTISRNELSEARLDERMLKLVAQDEEYDVDLDQPEDEIETETNDEGNTYEIAHDLEKGEFGIIFEKQVSLALRSPREDSITSRGRLVDMDTKGTPERIRRAKRFAADHHFKLLQYDSFAHEYTEKIYALVVNQKSFGKAVNLIRNNREIYGIRLSDMNPEIIEKEWQQYQTKIKKRLNDFSAIKPFAQRIYEHKWRKIHDPNYRISTTELIKEIEEQGYTFSEEEIVKQDELTELKRHKRRKRKERRRIEREKVEDEYFASDRNPFKIK